MLKPLGLICITTAGKKISKHFRMDIQSSTASRIHPQTPETSSKPTKGRGLLGEFHLRQWDGDDHIIEL